MIYTLEKGPMKCEISTLGATVRSLTWQGNELLMTYDDDRDWDSNPYFLNCPVAPNAGRIREGKLFLGDSVVQLPCNNGRHSLHSGPAGTQLEEFEVLFHSEDVIRLGYRHLDGRGGYPANIDFIVEYYLPDECEFLNDCTASEGKKERSSRCFLGIRMSALPDADTHINMTQHFYFNLGRVGESTMKDHRLYLNADFVYEVDEETLPTTKTALSESSFDFSDSEHKKRVGDFIPPGIDNPFLLKKEERFAHPFAEKAAEGEAETFLTKGATLRHLGIEMNAYTDQTAVVVYTNHHAFQNCRGICLEFQSLPAEMHVVKAGERYQNNLLLSFHRTDEVSDDR